MNTTKKEIVIYKGAPIGGLKAQYDIPETLDDFIDGLAEKLVAKNPALTRKEAVKAAKAQLNTIAVNDVLYHRVYTSLRAELTDSLIEGSKDADGKPTFEPKSEKRMVGDKEKEVIVEDDEPFARRAVAEGKATVADLNAKFTELAAHPDNAIMEFATSEGRTRAPKTAPKEAQAQVKTWADAGKLAMAVEKFATELGQPAPALADLNACALFYWQWHKAKMAAQIAAI